jgi:hypothetical protein
MKPDDTKGDMSKRAAALAAQCRKSQTVPAPAAGGGGGGGGGGDA